jgi:hypothetical protein
MVAFKLMMIQSDCCSLNLHSSSGNFWKLNAASEILVLVFRYSCSYKWETITYSVTQTHSHTLSRMHTHTLTHTLTHTQTITHSHTLTHTDTLTHSCTHTHLHTQHSHTHCWCSLPCQM